MTRSANELPDQEGADQLVEFSGSITDYWSYSQIRDYLVLMPGLSHTAVRLYLILRSMVTEASRRPRGGLRRMTIDQLCWLLPGPKGKPTSVSTMYQLLKELEQAGLIVPKDSREVEGVSGLKGKEKAAKGIARGFAVEEMPPTSYTGWRNAWDKLDAYRPDWRENPPQPPTHLTEYEQSEDGRMTARVRLVDADGGPFQKTGTDEEAFQKTGKPQIEGGDTPLFQKTGTSFQDSGTLSQDSGTDPALTSENDPPLRSSLKEALSSPVPPVTAAPSSVAEEGTEREERTAAPENPSASTAPSPSEGGEHHDVRVTEAWIASRQKHGHGVPPLARKRMIEQAAELLAEGVDPEYLVAAAADMGSRSTWYDLRRHLEKFVRPASVPGQRPALAEWCGVCNDGVRPTQPGQRLRELPDGRLIKCECHPSHSPAPVPA
ncbi:hypothetical protein [Streptomyces mangrovi]|uniref:hypothetical protein n=1 Tax=Streptomyces mangrovi TaxID=1206892 RepID=UPI00399D00F6